MTGPTRELPKRGYRLTLLTPARWNLDAFAGICLANGCPVDAAWKVARELEASRDRFITVRPLPDPEKFIAAGRALGVRIEEVPPK